MNRRGFSLLEVMVAIAILAGSLTALTVAVSRSVQASAHARLMTIATSLCRQQLVEGEEKYIVDGFTDDAGAAEDKGDFEDPAFKRFHWMRIVEKITLPSVDEIQTAATKALQDHQTQAGQSGQSGSSTPSIPGAGGSGTGGSSNSAGLGNGPVGAVLGPVKEMLEQGIRRVTMRVIWDEPGRPGQQVEVVTFYTDPRRVPAF